MTRHAETRYVDDWDVRRDGPTVFLDLYPPGATAADPPACSIALNRIAAENIGRNLQWAGQGVTTPPTPPRPERTPTDVLVERARAFCRPLEGPTAYQRERHAIRRGQQARDLLTALAKALEARDRRIAELESGLREIVVNSKTSQPDGFAVFVARALLERRAAGGEG